MGSHPTALKHRRINAIKLVIIHEVAARLRMRCNGNLKDTDGYRLQYFDKDINDDEIKSKMELLMERENKRKEDRLFGDGEEEGNMATGVWNPHRLQ